MSYGRFTCTDGLPVLIHFDEIKYVKGCVQIDNVYMKEYHFSLIVLKDGTEVKVTDTVDLIEETLSNIGY